MKNNVITATEARKELSSIIDTVVREKPVLIKRTRDVVLMTDVNLFNEILKDNVLHGNLYQEEDGSITASLDEIDLLVNEQDTQRAKHAMQEEILEYAKDYYNEFDLWSKAPNRKKHIKYVLQALILDDKEKIGDLIEWQHLKN